MTEPRAVRRPRPALRRRVDNVMLRWQARLDASWADRVVPWAAAVVLFVAYLLLALARARSLSGGAPLAGYAQAAWLITEGRAAFVTVSDGHLLSLHAPVGFYPLAQVIRFLPTVPALLGVQAAALALGVVPLWRLGRQVARLRVGATLALVLAYGVYPALNNLNVADFHPEALAVAPLLAATYAGFQNRWRPFALWCLLSVVWSAELGLVVAGLGLLLVLEGRRREGAWTAAFGLGWVLVAVVVLDGRYGQSGLVVPGAFDDYGTSAPGVVATMLTNPFTVLGDLVAEANLAVVVGLLAPLLFLPVLAPRYLLPALPLQALYLVADVPISGPEGAQFTVPALAFCFVAATFALARVGRRSIERVLVDRRVLIALAVAAVGFFALDAQTSPYREPWRWGREDVVDEARRAAADVVSDGAAVRASEPLLPLLAERAALYELEGRGTPDADAATAGGVNVIALDDRTVPDWSVVERLAFADALESQGFELLYRAQGISVYDRGGA